MAWSAASRVMGSYLMVRGLIPRHTWVGGGHHPPPSAQVQPPCSSRHVHALSLKKELSKSVQNSTLRLSAHHMYCMDLHTMPMCSAPRSVSQELASTVAGNAQKPIPRSTAGQCQNLSFLSAISSERNVCYFCWKTACSPTPPESLLKTCPAHGHLLVLKSLRELQCLSLPYRKTTGATLSPQMAFSNISMNTNMKNDFSSKTAAFPPSPNDRADTRHRIHRTIPNTTIFMTWWKPSSLGKNLSNEGVREAWSELKLKENSKFLCQAALLLTEGYGNSIKSLWDSAIYLLQQPAQRTQQWMAAQRPQKERFCQAVFSTLQCTEAVLPSKERTVQNCTLTGINEEAEACWKYHSQLFDVLNASFSWAGCKKPKMTVRGKKRSGLGK